MNELMVVALVVDVQFMCDVVWPRRYAPEVSKHFCSKSVTNVAGYSQMHANSSLPSQNLKTSDLEGV